MQLALLFVNQLLNIQSNFQCHKQSIKMELFLAILFYIVLLVIIAIPTVIFFIPYDYTWLFRIQDAREVLKIPGPKPLPYFGNVLSFNLPHDEILVKLRSMREIYGSIFLLWCQGIPGAVIDDPEAIEVILSSKNHISKSTIYKLLKPWLREGLLTSRGERWHSHRKIITPTFHFKILEQYIQIFNSNAAIMTDILEKRLHEPWISMNNIITNCTLDIICETAMGRSVHAQKGGSMEYVYAVKQLTNIMVHRYLSPWLHRDVVFNFTPKGREQKKLIKAVQNFTEEVIKKRKQEYMENKYNATKTTEKKRYLTFLDLLIEVSDKEHVLTDTDIQEEVDTFMFEGHDTTSLAAVWAVLMLGSHPQVQERVIKELEDIFGNSTREATYEDLQQMVYLEQVIKETLRLYPSVAGFARKLDIEAHICGKYRVPPGTEILIVPVLIHRNPDIYPNPDEFNPDHFLPQKVKDRHPFAYIPFSAGYRNCIGQRFAMLEEKVILSSLLRKFKIQAVDDPKSIPYMYELLGRPKRDIRVKLTLRTSTNSSV